jgi:hypothetical protein
LVDKLKLRNDVKADLRELILEHLKEHGQQVINSPGFSISIARPRQQGFSSANLLLLAEYRSEPTNLSTKGGTDMLGAVGDQILDAAHDIVEQCRPLNQGTEPWDLSCDCRPHLSLIIFEQLHK